MVAMLSEECERQGLKFGIAISPLDRHAESYGTGEEYNEYFKKLLREVLTKYGDIFYVRFDGAAEEIDGKRVGGKAPEILKRLQDEATISTG